MATISATPSSGWYRPGVHGAHVDALAGENMTVTGYQTVHVLGQGRYSDVFECTRLRDGANVAVKRMPKVGQGY